MSKRIWVHSNLLDYRIGLFSFYLFLKYILLFHFSFSLFLLVFLLFCLFIHLQIKFILLFIKKTLYRLQIKYLFNYKLKYIIEIDNILFDWKEDKESYHGTYIYSPGSLFALLFYNGSLCIHFQRSLFCIDIPCSYTGFDIPSGSKFWTKEYNEAFHSIKHTDNDSESIA